MNKIYELFSELEPLTPFDIKKEEIIAHLSALMSVANINRDRLIEMSGWSEKKLNGFLEGNDLDIRTIFEFTQYLGYKMDIVYQRQSYDRSWRQHCEQL
jgi:hypothetical protein